MSDKLTHFDAQGDAHMVDVGGKAVTDRVAVARCYIKMLPQTHEIISQGRAKNWNYWNNQRNRSQYRGADSL